MIRALLWTVVFLGLLGGGGAYLWTRLKQLWARSGELGRELAQLEALTGVVGSAAAELQQQRRADGVHPDTAPPAEPAVFRSPLAVAAERADLRQALAHQRAARRAARRPGWARHVH